MNVPDNYDMWLIYEAEIERQIRREAKEENGDTDETE